MPGRPTDLDNSTARAPGVEWKCYFFTFIYLIYCFLFSLSLRDCSISISSLFPYLRFKAQAETELVRVYEIKVVSDFFFCLVTKAPGFVCTVLII